MDDDRILKIYQSFLKSREYDEKFKNIDFDISWLNEKLTTKDILKLEDIIVRYASLNYKTMFKCGFAYAWELFTQCEERSLN